MQIGACALAMVAAVPLPAPHSVYFKNTAEKNQVQPIYYSIPLDYQMGYYSPPLEYRAGAGPSNNIPLVPLSEPVAKLEKQPEPTSPISQEIKLMLGIPIIPDGTSVSITVKVESSPSGPIVSVGNPTPLAPATPQTPKPDEDAVIVDANSAINAGLGKLVDNYLTHNNQLIISILLSRNLIHWIIISENNT